MIRTIARSGLAAGIALLLLSGARAQVADSGGIRSAILDGRLDEAKDGIRERLASLQSARTLNLPAAVELQTLELQLPGESGLVAAAFPEGSPDRAYLEARQHPEIAAFEAVLRLDPGHRPSRRALAVLKADDGNWTAAKAEFEALVKENPADAETRHRFAFAAYYAGDSGLAIDQWVEALDANPRHADAWYGVGVVWLGKGLWESAERALRKAVEWNPIHWKARAALVQALIAQGRFAEAQPIRDLLHARAGAVRTIGAQITIAVLPRTDGVVVWREGLTDGVTWLFRAEVFSQDRGGGKPIKIMELRRQGGGAVWGEVAPDGSFHQAEVFDPAPGPEQLMKELR